MPMTPQKNPDRVGAPPRVSAELLGMTGYVQMRKTLPSEEDRTIDEAKWKRDILDLHRMMALTQTVFLLLEHNNEAMIRVAVEIATDRIKRKCLWWPQTWFGNEETRVDFKGITLEKLYLILGWLKNLPASAFAEEDDEAKKTLTEEEAAAIRKQAEDTARELKARATQQELAEARCRDAEDALAAAHQRMSELEKSLDTMRKEMRETSDRGSISEKLQAKEAALEEANMEIDALKAKLAQAMHETKNAGAGAAQADPAEVAAMKKQLEELKKSSAEALMKAEKAEKRALEDLDRVRTEAMMEKDANLKANALLQSQLSAAKAEASEFRRKYEGEHAHAEDAEEAARRARLANGAHDDELEAMRRGSKAALSDLDRARQENDLLKLQLMEANQRANLAEGQLEAAKKEIDHLHEHGGEGGANSGMKKMRKEMKELQAQLDEKNEENEKLKSRAAAKQERIEALEAEKEEMEEERMRMLKMIDQLRRQLQKVKDLAVKKGLGHLMDEIFEEADLSKTLASQEFGIFQRLYTDALRRMEKMRKDLPVRTSPQPRGTLQLRGAVQKAMDNIHTEDSNYGSEDNQPEPMSPISPSRSSLVAYSPTPIVMGVPSGQERYFPGIRFADAPPPQEARTLPRGLGSVVQQRMSMTSTQSLELAEDQRSMTMPAGFLPRSFNVPTAAGFAKFGENATESRKIVGRWQGAEQLERPLSRGPGPSMSRQPSLGPGPSMSRQPSEGGNKSRQPSEGPGPPMMSRQPSEKIAPSVVRQPSQEPLQGARTPEKPALSRSRSPDASPSAPVIMTGNWPGSGSPTASGSTSSPSRIEGPTWPPTGGGFFADRIRQGATGRSRSPDQTAGCNIDSPSVPPPALQRQPSPLGGRLELQRPATSPEKMESRSPADVTVAPFDEIDTQQTLRPSTTGTIDVGGLDSGSGGGRRGLKKPSVPSHTVPSRPAPAAGARERPRPSSQGTQAKVAAVSREINFPGAGDEACASFSASYVPFDLEGMAPLPGVDDEDSLPIETRQRTGRTSTRGTPPGSAPSGQDQVRSQGSRSGFQLRDAIERNKPGQVMLDFPQPCMRGFKLLDGKSYAGKPKPLASLWSQVAADAGLGPSDALASEKPEQIIRAKVGKGTAWHLVVGASGGSRAGSKSMPALPPGGSLNRSLALPDPASSAEPRPGGGRVNLKPFNPK